MSSIYNWRAASTMLAALIISLIAPQIGQAQYFRVEEVVWNPENPDNNSDLNMVFCGHGFFVILKRDRFNYSIEGNTLYCNLESALSFDGGDVIEWEASHNWGRLEAGDYEVIFTTIIWQGPPPEGHLWRRQEFRFDLHISDEDRRVSVQLSQGWNLVSSHIDPEDHDIRTVMRGLNEVGSLVMVKNQLGQFYLPGRDFINIPRWDGRQGYLVNVNREASLQIEGEPFAVDTPILLRQGWNVIAYFPDEEIEAPVAFANISEILRIAKDGSGNFYYPDRGFNNLPALSRGKGYWVLVSSAGELIWNLP